MAAELPRVSKPTLIDPNYYYIYSVSKNSVATLGTKVPIRCLSNRVGITYASFYGHLFKLD